MPLLRSSVLWPDALWELLAGCLSQTPRPQFVHIEAQKWKQTLHLLRKLKITDGLWKVSLSFVAFVFFTPSMAYVAHASKGLQLVRAAEENQHPFTGKGHPMYTVHSRMFKGCIISYVMLVIESHLILRFAILDA